MIYLPLKHNFIHSFSVVEIKENLNIPSGYEAEMQAKWYTRVGWLFADQYFCKPARWNNFFPTFRKHPLKISRQYSDRRISDYKFVFTKQLKHANTSRTRKKCKIIIPLVYERVAPRSPLRVHWARSQWDERLSDVLRKYSPESSTRFPL